MVNSHHNVECLTELLLIFTFMDGWGSPAVASVPLSGVNQRSGLFGRRKTLLNKCKGQTQPLHCPMTCCNDSLWVVGLCKTWLHVNVTMQSADLLLFLCISRKPFCCMFILVVSICLCGLGLHGTSSAPCVIFCLVDVEHNCRLFRVHLSATFFSPYLSDPTIKITLRKLPSQRHYGTFAANYPENVFLLP